MAKTGACYQRKKKKVATGWLVVHTHLRENLPLWLLCCNGQSESNRASPCSNHQRKSGGRGGRNSRRQEVEKEQIKEISHTKRKAEGIAIYQEPLGGRRTRRIVLLSLCSQLPGERDTTRRQRGSGCVCVSKEIICISLSLSYQHTTTPLRQPNKGADKFTIFSSTKSQMDDD